MTNPKLREMLEAKALQPNQREPNRMISVDAALAVFTQYLQEPEVVERAAHEVKQAIVQNSAEIGEDLDNDTIFQNTEANAKFHKLIARLVLNSIGGEG